MSLSIKYRAATGTKPRRARSPRLESLEDRRLMTGGLDVYPLTTNGLGSFPAIVSGSDGNLWFAGDSDDIGRVTPSGVVTFFQISPNTTMEEPNSLTLGDDGNIWFTTYDSIGSITPTGTVNLIAIPGDHSGYAISTDPSGNLWFTDETGNVEEYSPTSGMFTTVTLPNASTNLVGSQSIAATADGAIWVSTYPTMAPSMSALPGGVVDRIDPSGTITTTVVSTSFDSQLNLTAGPDGNVWFADKGSDTVGSITAAGAITSYPVTGDTGTIATGPDGALWFTLPDNYPDSTTNGSAIGRVTTSGVATYYNVSDSLATAGDSDLGAVDAITAGPDGAIWITTDGIFEGGFISPPAGQVVSEQPVDGTIDRLDPSVVIDDPSGGDVPVTIHPAQADSNPGPIVYEPGMISFAPTVVSPVAVGVAPPSPGASGQDTTPTPTTPTTPTPATPTPTTTSSTSPVSTYPSVTLPKPVTIHEARLQAKTTLKEARIKADAVLKLAMRGQIAGAHPFKTAHSEARAIMKTARVEARTMFHAARVDSIAAKGIHHKGR